MWENTLAFLEQEEISSRTKNTKQLHNHKESINNTNRYAVCKDFGIYTKSYVHYISKRDKYCKQDKNTKIK